MKIKELIIVSIAFLALCNPTFGKDDKEEMRFIVDKGLNTAILQSKRMAESLLEQKDLLPRTIGKQGTFVTSNEKAWTSGFFPGVLWYLYEANGDASLKVYAEDYTKRVEKQQFTTSNHDVGFILYCSYGNGWRLTGNEEYKKVMLQGAQSLSTRFNPITGCIKSWDRKTWQYPVIIDNMMNLELMFEATRLSGDSSFYKIAVSHADRTMEEHFRPDGSCYHVIDYSIKDGKVRHRQTAQGYADESIWSRGQAWAIYGYAVCYRETKDRKYLDQALKTFNMMKNLENMPEDLIPYWDMSAPNIPNEPRDVSTASCIASALYEISTMDVPDAAGYKMYADSIMVSLSSPAYRAALGTNGNFLLMHSVGSIPHNSEIDVPLNYADYYYLEALKRKRDIEKGL